MNRPDWDNYFMTMAYLIASRSTDESTHAGAVIVRPDNSVVSTGYNGPVRGEENPPQERPEKYLHFEHAERNAIYNAAKHGTSLDGCKLYVNFLPCADCARGIVQAGIDEVIVHTQGQKAFEEASGNTGGEWGDSHKATMKIFETGNFKNPLGQGLEATFPIVDGKKAELIDELKYQGQGYYVDRESDTEIHVKINRSILRWWSGELWMPTGFFRGKEFDL